MEPLVGRNHAILLRTFGIATAGDTAVRVFLHTSRMQSTVVYVVVYVATLKVVYSSFFSHWLDFDGRGVVGRSFNY